MKSCPKLQIEDSKALNWKRDAQKVSDYKSSYETWVINLDMGKCYDEIFCFSMHRTNTV